MAGLKVWQGPAIGHHTQDHLEAARRAIVRALFFGDAIGFILSLIAQLGGVVNNLGWLTVVIYLVLAVGFGYFHLKKPAGTKA